MYLRARSALTTAVCNSTPKESVMKTIKIRKVGAVRLTAISYCYCNCCCC
jgi:hypothetical protein